MKKNILVLMFLVSMPFAVAMEPEEEQKMELLQFNGTSEADIVKMAQKLMLEATPQDQRSAPPADIQKSSMAKQLEYWVEKQGQPLGQQRLNRIFKLLDRANQTPLFINATDPVICPTALRELDVLVGSGTTPEHRSHSLAKRINHTKSHIGYTTLVRHLTQVKSTTNLRALQHAIQSMNNEVEVPENLRSSSDQTTAPLCTILRTHIKDISQLEDNFLSFWFGEDDYDQLDHYLRQKECKKLFFANDACNSSPFFLELQNIKDFVLPAVTPVAATGILGASIFTLHPLAIALSAGGAIWSFSNIPDTYKNYKVKIMALYLMQKNLIGLASFVDKLENLRKLLETNNFSKELTDSLELPTITPEMQNLKKLLNTTTFKSAPSFFSHWGRIWASYRLMLKKRDEFIKTYIGLGTIDFISSLNTLVSSSTDKAPYCYADYTDTANIGIRSEACWSPLLDPNSVVTNDIQLGGDNPKTFIITGPNARGKTTVMRSAVGAALLGSTIGIGSAKTLVIPAKLDFLTSINIGDDPHRKLSLFKAVAERMGQILYTLRAQPARPCLIVADEPFVGTDQSLAQASTARFIRHIARKPNSLALFSSHLKVTQLAKKFPKLIKNYHLADGYKFVPGIDPNPEEYDEIALGIIAQAFGDPEFVAEVRQDLAHLREQGFMGINKLKKTKEKTYN